MQRHRIAEAVLLAGQCLVLAVFGFQKLTDARTWIGWMPAWMDGFAGLTDDRWLFVIGVAELLLVTLLLFPVRRVRQLGALLLSLHLLSIVFVAGWTETGIRDIGLLTGAVALLFLL